MIGDVTAPSGVSVTVRSPAEYLAALLRMLSNTRRSAQESFRRDPQTASRLYKKPAPIAFAMGAAAFWGDFLCLAQACVSPR